MDIDMNTGGNNDEKNMEQKTTCRMKKRRRKSKTMNPALCEDMEICDQGAAKTTLGEILISEKMEISNSEMQDTCDVEITVQCPIQEHMDTTGNQVEKSTEKKKKRRRKPKAHQKDNLQNDQGAERTTSGEILILENMEISKSEMQDTGDVEINVQCPIQEHMDTTGNQVEKSTEKKRKRRKKPKAHQKDNLQSDQGAEKTTLGKILILEKMEISKCETQDTHDIDRTVQCPIQEHMDTTGNLAEKSIEKKKKRRRRKPKAHQKDNLQSDQGEEKTTLGEMLILEKKEISKSEMQDTRDVDITVQCPIQEHMDTTGNQVEKSTENKKKMRRKPKAHQKDNLQSDQGAEKTTLGEILILEKMEISKSEIQDTRDVDIPVQCLIQEHMHTTGNQVEKSTEKKKKRRRKPKAHQKDNLQSDQGAEKTTLGENLISEKMKISKSEMQDTHDVAITVQCTIQEHMNTTENQVEKSTEKKKKRKRRKPKAHQKDNLQSMHQTEVVSALSLSDKPRDAGRNARLENIEATSQERRLSTKENFRPSDINEERFKCDPVAVLDIVNNFLKVSHPSPEITPVVRLRRKLLILDVNGLLADVVFPPPKECKADVNISRRAIFMRPFCCDFLRFCFEGFDVGIWSSRSMKVLDPVIDYLLGDMKHKLLFFWDKSQCTATRFKTLENRHKPLVFKDLRKIWEKSDPKLSWEKGDYNESNTLLLDDSPYKALLNPVYTGVFPCSYTFKDSSDNSLGPGGDLRVYLERLASADNCKEFVEKHPFGQRGIDESSSCWDFYSKVLSSRSNL